MDGITDSSTHLFEFVTMSGRWYERKGWNANNSNKMNQKNEQMKRTMEKLNDKIKC